jgi:RadC-like JAB domain
MNSGSAPSRAAPSIGPIATVRVLPEGIEVCAREYIFRLADDAARYAGPTTLAGLIAQNVIGAEVTECALGVFFGDGGRMIGFSHLARGKPNVVCLQAADLIRPAMRLGASGAVLAHNHPTGDTTPSRADIVHAEQVGLGMNAMGLRLLAAVVVTLHSWHSFWEFPTRPISRRPHHSPPSLKEMRTNDRHNVDSASGGAGRRAALRSPTEGEEASSGDRWLRG